MKSIKNIKLTVLLLGLIAPLLTAIPVFAASGTMSLTGGSVAKGGTIVVSIRVNSGSQPINAAGATVTYPTSKLAFVSASNSSAFPISAQNSGGGGTVAVQRGAFSPVSGSQTVAYVTFRALTDTGTAALGLTPIKVVSATDSSSLAISASGTTISFHAPAVVAPPDTTPPTITAINVAAVAPDSATITWTTSEPATSEVMYGINTGYGLSAVDTNHVTAHSVVVQSPFIVPATTYHFMIRSADAAGNAATSADSTFTTTGATVVVKVIDQNKTALKGASVEIDNQKATTNSGGQATLKDIGLGKKVLVVTYKGQKYPINIEITDANTPQNITASIKVPRSYVLPIVILVLLLIAAAYLLGRGSGHGPARSTLVGFGLMGHKLPLPRPFKQKISDFVTVKDTSAGPPPPPAIQ